MATRSVFLFGLVRCQRRQAVGSLAGGGIEFGESPAECAVREAREEAGLSIMLRSFLSVSSDVTTNASSDCNTHTIRLIFEGFVESGRCYMR